ncbi:hypothetical protein FH603_5192 [Spirosoma sp. LMG 31447]|uniref:Uncharacterized protein n=1 Tax=Spirosoma utsteinense TaxID=2585773 RepID=A0ABR6WDM7_9BACT|nr:hypothetical protein [Spirosoma utsteinense]
MIRGLFYLLSTWIVSSACEGRYPLKIDFETASATVIGRETCNTDSSLNAWLIDLGPTTSGITSGVYYGKEATVNRKYYAHVVKTYSPLVSRLDSTKPYFFDFYVENALPKPSCNLPITTSFNVPQIRVTAAPIWMR